MKHLDYALVTEKICQWLRDYLQKTKADGFVVGLSGGIDSSVVGALCRRVTPNTLGVSLPCNSSPEAERDAKRVSEKFGITRISYNLKPMYDAFVGTVSSTGVVPSPNQLALGNIKARLRMVTLYYLANSLNRLVVGCGNGIEISIGYFTKYGDGGADLWPIGDLLKQDVRGVAVYLGVPDDIIKKAPTADLWPGQTDEGEIGITYDLLDMIIGGDQDATIPDSLKNKVNGMKIASFHKNPLAKHSPTDLICPIRHLFR